MPVLPQFDPPANNNDFLPNEQEQEKELRARWSDNLNRFTEQTLQNDPWSSINQPAPTHYYNPLTTDIPAGTKGAPITWTAFPNRIKFFFPNVGQRKQWEYADDGPPQGGPYPGPTGPRGWQDEYCEWSVTRNAQGQITKVMFTCENREYFYTLWDVDPGVVLRIYKQLVGEQVVLEDLYLRDDRGNPIIDPATARPAYNDRNKWNNSTTHGAVHLISNPNSLSAEIFLAGQATVLRETAQDNPITDPSQLINCSRYGTPNRNSDPTIGATVNNLVRSAGVRISLENPVGLYIQEPNFGVYQLPFTAPSDASASDYWKIVRGRRREGDEDVDFILHAVYEVPPELGFTVSDITINGFPIDFGSQITETFQIALSGLPVPQLAPSQSYQCAGTNLNPLPRPYVLRSLPVLQVGLRSGINNMRISQGERAENIALFAFDSDRNATIEFTGGPGVRVEKTGFQTAGGGSQIFILTITVAADAPTGNRSLLLTNADGSKGPAVFGLLEVVAPGSPLQATPPLSASEPLPARDSLIRLTR